MAIDEFSATWPIVYGMFRLDLWLENYGTYRDIDADFKVGKLDDKFKQWFDQKKAKGDPHA